MKKGILLLAGLLFMSVLFGQNRTVSGFIFDEYGASVPGANVYSFGYTQGTSSDENGFFEIEIPKTIKELRVSHISYKPKDIQLNCKRTFDVVLESGNALPEVVVVDYDVPAIIRCQWATGGRAETMCHRPYYTVHEEIRREKEAQVRSKKAGLKLFPNPAFGKLTIESRNPISRLNIYSVTGQKIATIKAYKQLEVRLDLQELPPSTYFLEVWDNSGQRMTRKLILLGV